MILSSIVDLGVACLMSVRGILMAPLPSAVIASVILACALYLIAVDFPEGPNFVAPNVYVVWFCQKCKYFRPIGRIR
jgi:hypothetical protein